MKSTETLEELQEELTRINNLLANVVRHVAVRLPISRSYSGLKTVDNWDKNEQQRMWAALNSLLRIYKNYFMRSEDIRRMICKKRGEKYIRPDNLGLQTPS